MTLKEAIDTLKNFARRIDLRPLEGDRVGLAAGGVAPSRDRVGRGEGAYNVWRLITPDVMRGLELMRRHLKDGGHDWSHGTAMADVAAADEWLRAAKADQP